MTFGNICSNVIWNVKRDYGKYTFTTVWEQYNTEHAGSFQTLKRVATPKIVSYPPEYFLKNRDLDFDELNFYIFKTLPKIAPSGIKPPCMNKNFATVKSAPPLNPPPPRKTC